MLKRKINIIKIKEYITILKHCYIEIYKNFKNKVILIIALELLGMSTQVFILGSIVNFGKIQKKIQESRINFFFNKESDLLMVLGVSLGIFYAFSSYILYISKKETLKIGSEFERIKYLEILSKIKNQELFFEDVEAGNNILLTALISDIRISGLIVKYLIKLLIPVGTILVSFPTLILLERKLTGILGSVFIIYLISLFILNKKSIYISKKLEENTRIFSKDLNEKLNGLLKIPIFEKKTRKNLYNELKENEKKEKNIIYYEERLKLTEENLLISDLFLSIFILIIFIYLKIVIIDYKIIITYFISLRYLHTSLKKVTTIIVSLNRFYPQLNRCYTLLNSSFLDRNKYGISNIIENPVEITLNGGINYSNIRSVLLKIYGNDIINNIAHIAQYIYIDSFIEECLIIEFISNYKKNIKLIEFFKEMNINIEDIGLKIKKEKFNSLTKENKAIILIFLTYFKEKSKIGRAHV